MLENSRHDLHVLLVSTPRFRTVLDLNLDDFSCVLAQVDTPKFANQFLHNEAALVCDQVVLDPIFLIAAQLISESEHLADRLFNSRVQVMRYVDLQERHSPIELLITGPKFELLEALVEELQ